jgi:hypothetical protein
MSKTNTTDALTHPVVKCASKKFHGVFELEGGGFLPIFGKNMEALSVEQAQKVLDYAWNSDDYYSDDYESVDGNICLSTPFGDVILTAQDPDQDWQHVDVKAGIMSTSGGAVGPYVDTENGTVHINGNTLDNRRANIRWATADDYARLCGCNDAASHRLSTNDTDEVTYKQVL